MTEQIGKQPATPAAAGMPKVPLSLILGLVAIAAALIVTHGSVITEMFSRQSADSILASGAWDGFWTRGVWTWVLIGGVFAVGSWIRGQRV